MRASDTGFLLIKNPVDCTCRQNRAETSISCWAEVYLHERFFEIKFLNK